MKPILILMSVLWLINCNSSKSKLEIHIEDSVSYKIQTEIRVSTDSLNYKDMMGLRMEEALEKYGAPAEWDSFIMNDGLPEFRINLYNVIKEEAFLHKSLKIQELTWDKDPDYNITVWYRQTGDVWTPVDVYIWVKGSEF